MTQANNDPAALLERSQRLFDRAQVHAALDHLADLIYQRFTGQSLLFLTVMNGGMIPGAWLATRLRQPFQMDYVHATRYQGGLRGENLEWIASPHKPVAGQNVLIFDDIFDEGYTLQAIKQYCLEQGASQVVTAVLVRKQHERGLPRNAVDLVGLEVPDQYVFGCGMDVHEYWRQLEEIWVLGEE